MRPATNDEQLRAELVNRYLSDMRWDVQHTKGPKKFVDVRAEGAPLFPGDEVVQDPDDEMPDLTDEEVEELEPGSRQVSEPQPMSERATEPVS